MAPSQEPASRARHGRWRSRRRGHHRRDYALAAVFRRRAQRHRRVHARVSFSRASHDRRVGAARARLRGDQVGVGRRDRALQSLHQHSTLWPAGTREHPERARTAADPRRRDSNGLPAAARSSAIRSRDRSGRGARRPARGRRAAARFTSEDFMALDATGLRQGDDELPRSTISATARPASTPKRACSRPTESR